MDDSGIVTITQISSFLKTSALVTFKGVSRKDKYRWVENTLNKFRYFKLKKVDKGIIKNYLIQMTGFSPAQTAKLGMVQSMSRKGNCIDNAPIESFFGHFKDDVDYKICKTFEQLNLLIEEYVKYYNHDRYQWERKKMTPVAYRNHLLEFAR